MRTTRAMAQKIILLWAIPLPQIKFSVCAILLVVTVE
jgi:hypothetical protein